LYKSSTIKSSECAASVSAFSVHEREGVVALGSETQSSVWGSNISRVSGSGWAVADEVDLRFGE